MRKTICFIMLMAILALSSTSFAGAIVQGTMEYCTDQFPFYPDLQKACFENQKKNMVQFTKYIDKYFGSVDNIKNRPVERKKERNIIHNCTVRYQLPLYGTFNFNRIVTCIESNLKLKDKILY